ncbi:MAG: Gfo/Idh/MocA family oxidoreductase [Spirochaetaceae bacterium]|nr:Gfo/Idh/MocA family oxidoreductase [Spirochaetaceae bacterium]
MKVCVVGYGMMGVWHSEALAEGERYFVVGRRPEPTAEFAARYGYRRWSVDLEEALADPAVDAVIVASPSELHAAMALRCLAHGKPTLVEIPIAMSYAASERVVAEAERRGITLGVVHPMRFRKERAPLRERLANGAEHLRHIHGRFFIHRLKNVGATGYHRSWIDNLLWHHTTHLLDLGLWMLAVEGAPIRSVSHFMPAPDPHTGIPMEVVLLVETGADQSLLCSGSYYSRERIYDTMIVTDRDSYRLNILEGTLTTGAGTAGIDSEQDNCALCTRDFVAALEQGREPAVPGRAVLPTMRLLQDVQDRWDAVHGRRSLPGRPLDEEGGQGV